MQLQYRCYNQSVVVKDKVSSNLLYIYIYIKNFYWSTICAYNNYCGSQTLFKKALPLYDLYAKKSSKAETITKLKIYEKPSLVKVQM